MSVSLPDVKKEDVSPVLSPTLFAFDYASPSTFVPSLFRFSPGNEFDNAWPGTTTVSAQAQLPESPLSFSDLQMCTPLMGVPHVSGNDSTLREIGRRRSRSEATWPQSHHPYFNTAVRDPRYPPLPSSSSPPEPLAQTSPKFYTPCNVFHGPTSLAEQEASLLSSPEYSVSPTSSRQPVRKAKIGAGLATISGWPHVIPDSQAGDGIDGGPLGVSLHLEKPRTEDIRIMRIESEQRRRDELREGFTRLRDALPSTKQRASKANLLDRSVAHIQSIEAANRYLSSQLELASKEVDILRLQNHDLVQAVARH